MNNTQKKPLSVKDGWATCRNNNSISIIDKINSKNIIIIFKKYNLNIDNYNKKIICPFASHCGGGEKTASFYYYPDTNSFFCFGCKKGGKIIDFISYYEEITKQEAIQKAINILTISYDEDVDVVSNDFNEILKAKIDFANKIQIFLHKNPSLLNKVEELCVIYDNLNIKYNLDLKAINKVCSKLLERLEKCRQ